MKSIEEFAAWLYDRRLRGFHGKNMQKCEDEATDIIAFLTSKKKKKNERKGCSVLVIGKM